MDKEIVINIPKSFVCKETMTVNEHECPSCNYTHVVVEDKYCCNCGVKLKWEK